MQVGELKKGEVGFFMLNIPRRSVPLNDLQNPPPTPSHRENETCKINQDFSKKIHRAKLKLKLIFCLGCVTMKE